MVGTVIENYKIVSVLGEGGMGTVYKAFDIKLERYIAIKILNQQALKNPQFIERFKREAKNQAKLNHPNIVPVYGFTEFQDLLGIVMEYISGETLEHLIERKGKLELPEAIGIFKQVLLGVAFAHSKGFVHRDLKPSNIIINMEGIAKIMDFGISKSLHDVKGITKTGTKLGTILYMSPEQIKAQDPTLQSDIYSLGITFYEMLCGKTPFEAPTDFHIMEAHLKKKPTKLSTQLDTIPPVVDDVLSKALSKSTLRRFHSCEEFAAELDTIPLSPYKALKLKRKTRQKTAQISERPRRRYKFKNFFKKLKMIGLILVGTTLFAVLCFFIYQQVSNLLIPVEKKNQKLFDEGTNPYSSNPSYLKRSSWKSIDCPVIADLNGVTFINDSIGFACGTNSAIIKTKDGGKSWNAVHYKDSSATYYDIKFFNSRIGIIVGEKGAILLSENGGANWFPVKSDVSESLFGIKLLPNSNIGFIVGGNGIILKTIDSGLNWKRVLSPSRNLLYSLDFISKTEGFAVGWNGELLKTMDQGDTWNKMDQLSYSYFRDIRFANNDLGIIVGGGGEIFRTSNGGANWEKISSGTISGLYSISFLDEKNGLVLGTKGGIYVTDDGGENWKSTSSGRFEALTQASVLPSKKVVVVGYNGAILLSQ